MTAVAEQRILLHDVSWQTYEALLREFDCRPIRLTYDRGALEIRTLSHGHEHSAHLLGRLVEALTVELNVPIHSGGSTTFHQEAKQRGLEPDECYWVQNEPRMRGRKEFDFDADPPPDLAIEVDISRSSLNGWRSMPRWASARCGASMAARSRSIASRRARNTPSAIAA